MGKGVEQARVARQVRHDAQLDLRVVGRDDARTRRRDEGLADAPALFGADRDVLQVRVGAGEPPGDRHGLGIVGVHAPRGRVDRARQLVGVGALQLGHAAVVEDQLRQRVVERQLFQHLLVGGRRAGRRLLQHRQLLALEEDLLDLLRRIQVEGLLRHFVRLPFDFQHAQAELLPLPLQQRGVDQHAVPFHAEEDLHHRHLDVAVKRFQPRFLGEARGERPVQAQGDVGILGGVFGGALDVDLVEADAAGALAGDLVVLDGGDAEVAQRHRIHVVALVGFDDVGREHRVVGDAFEAQPVIGEHVHVVLQVLAELGVARRFQPGLQLRQCLVESQLLRHAGVAVGERQVGGLARRHGEGHPDQPRLHRVEAGGFGVEGGEGRGVELLQPGVELRPVEDRFVASAVGAGGLQVCAFPPHPGPLPRGGRGRIALQLSEPGLELEAREQLGEFVLVGRLWREVFHLHRQREVADHGDELFAERQEIQVLAQVLADLAADFIGMGDDGVERTVLLQPFRRRLRPDLVHPRDVVHAVADQREIVDDALRPDAELRQHAGLVEHLVAHGVHQPHVRVDQLRQVLVAGGHHALDALAAGFARQRADDVVGLDALDGEQRPAQRADAVVQRFDLAHEVVGHRRPLRLVFRVPVVAEGLALGVEDAGAIRDATERLEVAIQPA